MNNQIKQTIMEFGIEYRVWDKFNGMYWYSERYKNLSSFFSAMEYYINGGNELIFERSTGLTDKNGKKIFEGDIIKVESKSGFNSNLLEEFKNIHNLDSINGISMHFIGIVRIDLFRGLMFENPKNGYKEPIFNREINIKINLSGIEIIGNIHENQELLQS